MHSDHDIIDYLERMNFEWIYKNGLGLCIYINLRRENKFNMSKFAIFHFVNAVRKIFLRDDNIRICASVILFADAAKEFTRDSIEFILKSGRWSDNLNCVDSLKFNQNIKMEVFRSRSYISNLLLYISLEVVQMYIKIYIALKYIVMQSN